MRASRKFKSANYEETLTQTIRPGEAPPAQHLARFVVEIIAQLDLSRIYGQYAPVCREAIALEIGKSQTGRARYFEPFHFIS